MKKYKIGIADDHTLFAEGIGNILTTNTAVELSFIVASVPELKTQLQSNPIDILFLDVNMPPYNGIDVIPELKQQYKDLKVLIISMYQPIDIGLNLAQFKGDGYVLKISGKHILEAAIDAAIKGEQYIDPNIIQQSNAQDAFSIEMKLSKREKEIISLIALGKTTRDIAELLFISELTVKTHRKNISEKLGTKGLADLLSRSIRYKNDKF